MVLYWVLCFVLALFAWRVWSVWPRLGQKRPAQKKKLRTMILLGSGGHTAELMPVVAALPKTVYTPRIYVVADERSKNKALAFEGTAADAEVCSIPRAREVGQSYVTSVATTLHALVHSVWLVMSRRPELILCNGPAICIPIAVAVLLLRVVRGSKACGVVFIESGCRVEKVNIEMFFGG